jgi:GWxTD domain-containing protein
MQFLRAQLIVLALSVHPLSLPSAFAQKTALRVVEEHPYKKWLNEDVVYIITDQERSDFKNLATDKQRDDFITQFWERRNPTSGSLENTFKEENYRRIAYSNEHFAAAIPGWKTDRGRIYIIYGPPNSVESHTDASPPIQIWHYALLEGSSNVALTFTDKSGAGDYTLKDTDLDWLRKMREGK